MTSEASLDPVASDGSAVGHFRLAADPTLLHERVLAADAAWTAAAGETSSALVDEARSVVADFVVALEAGDVRAATPDPEAQAGWRVEAWVKTGILLGFRLPGMTEYRDGPIMAARDRSAYGVLDLLESESSQTATEAGAPWRVVPGGTTIRDRSST